jgi:uridylate kinase
MEHDLPILVFNYRVDGNIERAVRGEDIGTLVSSREPEPPTEEFEESSSGVEE